MDRVISQEERIRRAEEIYYRRQRQNLRVSSASVNFSEKKRVSLGRKMLIQLIVCCGIYFLFFSINNSNNANIIELKKIIRDGLNYDINFSALYGNTKNYIDNLVSKSKYIAANSEEIIEDKSEEKSVENSEENSEQKSEENIQDSSESEKIKNNIESTESNKSQMEIDAEYVKQNFNIIKPVNGAITSKFGNREQTEIISAFHQGIDISAVTGTEIHAAIAGTVIEATFNNDYGNYIKVQNNDVITVYAHCSELGVSAGETVMQDQIIGKVGQTGKATGPHLHFEIRKDNRYVDPEMILNFE